MFSYVYKDIDIAHKFDRIPVMLVDYSKHYHDFYEIYYFVRGNAIYTVEDEKMLLQPNNIIFIQPGEHHFVSFTDTSPYERYVIKIHDNLVPEFLKDIFIKRSAFYTNTEDFLPVFQKLDDLYKNYNAIELQYLFSGVVTELLIKLFHSEFSPKTINTNDIVTAMIQYINKNIRLPLTAQDLCKEFNFSKSYLYSEFHLYMKIPLMKYIRSKKIIAAHQLISRGQKPTSVAESFGYIDYTTFYRSFISVMGFPPSRRNNK